MFKRRSKRRVRPLLDIHSTWYPGSRYPDELDVAMQNGRIVKYEVAVHLPCPVFLPKFRTGWVVGYQYRENKNPATTVATW